MTLTSIRSFGVTPQQGARRQKVPYLSVLTPRTDLSAKKYWNKTAT
jgi:hypothetical protein